LRRIKPPFGKASSQFSDARRPRPCEV